MNLRNPLAYAGALTDQGYFPPEPTSSLYGVAAQAGVPMVGHAPFVLLRPMVDTLSVADWWNTLDPHTAHTAPGLHAAIVRLFERAGVRLFGGAPGLDDLDVVFDSPEARDLFDEIGNLHEVPQWRRDDISRGGQDTRAYAFVRLLTQLLDAVGAWRHHLPHEDHREALHQLARIGTTATRWLDDRHGVSLGHANARFRRLAEGTALPSAALTAPADDDVLVLHRRRVQSADDPSPFPEVSAERLQAVLSDSEHPLLNQAERESLHGIDRELARMLVELIDALYGTAPAGDWRTNAPTAQAWRDAFDQMPMRWEHHLGVLIHRVAAVLQRLMPYGAMSRLFAPDSMGVNDLRVRLGRLLEPLRELYVNLDLPMDAADPGFGDAIAAIDTYINAAGNAYSSHDAAAWLLPPAQWLEQANGNALAAAYMRPDDATPHAGVMDCIQKALLDQVDASGPDADADLILQGPSLLGAWSQSTAAAETTGSVLDRVRNAGLPLARWDTGSPLQASTSLALLRKAVCAVLPDAADDWIERAVAYAQAGADGGAPVLSLAISLRARDTTLSPDEALAFAMVLLATPTAPTADAVPSARSPLQFPLSRDLTAPSHTDDPALAYLQRWLPAVPADAASSPGPTSNAPLPPLNALLDSFGLPLLAGDGLLETAPALGAAERWALMARTRPFEELCRPRLEAAGWYGGASSQPYSPMGAQTLLAQQMLDQYLGPDVIEAQRRMLASADTPERTIKEVRIEIRTAIVRAQRAASADAVDLLFWLLVSELQQPALLVADVPHWLPYGGSLESAAFLHGVALAESMEPGASARASYVDLVALPAQLAHPPTTAGENDVLNDAWARALVPAAVRYAAATGALPSDVSLDPVTPAQTQAAVDALINAQEQHALHASRLLVPPPSRKEMASRVLTEAGVDAAYWSLPLDQLPPTLLQTHGLKKAFWLEAEQGAVEMLWHTPRDPSLAQLLSTNALTTDNDSLEDLVIADAVASVNGPSVSSRFNAAFDLYEREVETGLADIIAGLLKTLPAAQRAQLDASTCTPLRLVYEGREGLQGVLLRCTPLTPDNAAPFHIEVFPSAGVARLAWAIPDQGEWVESSAYVDGELARAQVLERFHGVNDANLVAADGSVPGQDVAGVAKAAARHLWQHHLAQVKVQILAEKTGLEKLLDKEKHILNRVAEFVIPFYKCAEDLIDGDHSTSAVVGCAMDVGFSVLPVGRFLGSTVRLIRESGSMSVRALAAESGHALTRLATDIAQQSGIFLVRDLAKGALWVGGKALELARLRAPWLGRLLQRADSAAHSGVVAQAVLDGKAPMSALEQPPTSLGAAELVDGQRALVVADANRWHRYDPVNRQPYGPALRGVKLSTPLPETIPVVHSEHGVLLNLGNTHNVEAIERAPEQWDVWIDGKPYTLEPGDNMLRARPKGMREDGHFEREEQRSCRVKRGLGLDPTSCDPGEVRLKYSPDDLLPLPDSPSPSTLEAHAAGHREYTLASVKAPGDEGMPSQLVVDEGQVKCWERLPIGPGKRAKARAPVEGLVPLTAEKAAALGVPWEVTYPEELEASWITGTTFGIPATTSPDAAAAVDEKVPLIEIDSLVPGIADRRRVRGIVVGEGTQQRVCIEADGSPNARNPTRGVFYEAAWNPTQSSNVPLKFRRMTSSTDIDIYLEHSEEYRIGRSRASAKQDHANIKKHVYGLLRRNFSDEELRKFPTPEAFEAEASKEGEPEVLNTYVRRVMSADNLQEQFVKGMRSTIPDWSKLSRRPLEEQQSTVDTLNKLLPIQGREEGWKPFTVESLQRPEAFELLSKNTGHANLAFAEVCTRDGRCIVYYALSDGKSTKNLMTQTPHDPDGKIEYVDARAEMRGQPLNPELTSLPVLRHAEDTRLIVFHRHKDAERLIGSVIVSDLKSNGVRHLNADDIVSVRVFTTLDACRSCSLVLAHLNESLPKAKISVDYLKDYH
ncbi:deaminase domain-containing protein [Stenotrophomonas sp.]|uniref:deaminase domain-containing protein n=1 Tax=Stenotrophomonas sp. TaxID=69392 RepID=UPI00289B13BC|nr:deaminase domain-containing protein [Stenotrophomonas sp.]